MSCLDICSDEKYGTSTSTLSFSLVLVLIGKDGIAEADGSPRLKAFSVFKSIKFIGLSVELRDGVYFGCLFADFPFC